MTGHAAGAGPCGSESEMSTTTQRQHVRDMKRTPKFPTMPDGTEFISWEQPAKFTRTLHVNSGRSATVIPLEPEVTP
jgi:hypothetical protein